MAFKRMDWPSLPNDLAFAVFSFLLADADRVRFRGVCATWRSSAAAWRPRPWLVGSRTDRSGQGATMSSFWLSRGDGLVPFDASVPAGLEYLSSSNGYLALSDPKVSPKSLILVNPVSGRLVPLPPIGFFKKWLDVTTVVLSADPETTDYWAALAVGFPTTCLAYYSSATTTWTPLDFSVSAYAGVEYYKGQFYVAFKSQICVCELGKDTPAVIPLENADGEDVDAGGRIVETHLVECDGELLLVTVRDDVDYTSDDETIFANVDVDGGGGGKARAVEVHMVLWVGEGAVRLVRQMDLGARALFLGRNRAFALSPSEFPACHGNCVYLVDRQGHQDGLVRVFHIERQWSPPQEMVCPGDRRGLPSAGWARRGWFFPNY